VPDSIIADFERWIELGAPAPTDHVVATKAAPKKIDFAAARKQLGLPAAAQLCRSENGRERSVGEASPVPFSSSP